jgi:hypothetical protein
MAASDAMLLGRVTYEEFAAFWPFQVGSDENQQIADYMNNTPKYVVSTTLEEPLEWQNSTLIKENVAEEVAKLKQQPCKDISITGSGTLVRSPQLDPNLTLTRTQHSAILGRRGNRKPLTYAGFATLCTAQQPMTAHS